MTRTVRIGLSVLAGLVAIKLVSDLSGLDALSDAMGLSSAIAASPGSGVARPPGVLNGLRRRAQSPDASGISGPPRTPHDSPRTRRKVPWLTILSRWLCEACLMRHCAKPVSCGAIA